MLYVAEKSWIQIKPNLASLFRLSSFMVWESSMNSMNGKIPPPPLPGWKTPRAAFLTVLDSHLCCHCGRMLYQPLQTVCGHKCCLPCVESLLAENPNPPCPAEEDSCSQLAVSAVFPDFATFREMMQFEVSCVNSGCSETMKFKELQSHLEGCNKGLPCSVMGCDFKGSSAELENHGKTACSQHVTLLSQALAGAMEQIKKTEEEKTELQQLNQDFRERLDRQESQYRALESRFNEFSAGSTQKTEALDLQCRSLESRLTDLSAEARMQHSETEALKTVMRISGGSVPQTLSAGFALSDRDVSTTTFMTVLTWKIDRYHKRKQDEVSGRAPCQDSEAFHIGERGYKMTARAYLNGDGLGKGKYLSLYVALMKSPNDERLRWPFVCRIAIALVDQLEPDKSLVREHFDPSPRSVSYHKPQSGRNKGSGFPVFAEHLIVESPRAMKDDSITLLVQVDKSSLDHIFMDSQ